MADLSEAASSSPNEGESASSERQHVSLVALAFPPDLFCSSLDLWRHDTNVGALDFERLVHDEPYRQNLLQTLIERFLPELFGRHTPLIVRTCLAPSRSHLEGTTMMLCFCSVAYFRAGTSYCSSPDAQASPFLFTSSSLKKILNSAPLDALFTGTRMDASLALELFELFQYPFIWDLCLGMAQQHRGYPYLGTALDSAAVAWALRKLGELFEFRFPTKGEAGESVDTGGSRTNMSREMSDGKF